MGCPKDHMIEDDEKRQVAYKNRCAPLAYWKGVRITAITRTL